MRLLSPSVPAKVAIPKIRKPPPAAPAPGPLVLQLGPDGNYYTKTSLTVPLSSMVVKAETVSGIQSPASYCSPMVAGLPTVTSNSGEDVRNMKRQQRMIKNRESACISRKKKKEYVTSLEDHIKTLSAENMQLKGECENLRSKVRELESEKKLWTASIIGSANGKKATAVFALLLLVSLNISSLSSIKAGQPFPKGMEEGPRIKSGGRSLMSVLEEDPSNQGITEENSLPLYQRVEMPANLSASKPPPMCT